MKAITMHALLAASLALGVTSAARAAEPTTDTTAKAMQVAQSTPMTRSETSAAATPSSAFPPQEAGVRKAAAEGSTALRRYVHRTRIIYGYSYWDFAKYLRPE